LRTFEGHTEGVNDVSWSSDGDFLASASDDKSIILWSLETVELLLHLYYSFSNHSTKNSPVKTLLGHTNFVFCVNFNPRSNLLVTGGYDETVRVWDVARGLSDLIHA